MLQLNFHKEVLTLHWSKHNYDQNKTEQSQEKSKLSKNIKLQKFTTNLTLRPKQTERLQQQQLSQLSQVFGGRLREPKENYAGSGTWISFLHSFLSSNVPSLRPLASISCRITSIHVLY